MDGTDAPDRDLRGVVVVHVHRPDTDRLLVRAHQRDEVNADAPDNSSCLAHLVLVQREAARHTLSQVLDAAARPLSVGECLERAEHLPLVVALQAAEALCCGAHDEHAPR